MYINVAICDDEKIFREMLNDELSKVIIENVTFKTTLFETAKELINKIKSGTLYHIVFMDIDLHEKSLGTDAGSIIKTINPDTLLIYVSGYDSYYRNMVSAEPFDFLSKPVNAEKLTSTINSALQRIYYIYHSYLYKYKTNGAVNTVNLKDVMYFESKHRIVVIHMKNQSELTFYSKLDDVEQDVEKICSFFLRVSKSFFINTNYIKYCTGAEAGLTDDTKIRVTSKYTKAVISYIVNFMQ